MRFHFRLGIGMQNVVQRYRLNRNGLLHETEEELAAGLRSSPVEPEGELVQVVVKMFVLTAPWCVPISQRLRSAITRWTRGINCDAVFFFFLRRRMVISCSYPSWSRGR